MQLEIITTTDGKHVGKVVTCGPAITLASDEVFRPTSKTQILPGIWRVFSSTYVIDGKELNHG
jgi:hypothetical protein